MDTNVCSLILYDVPENTEIGIDLKFWRVGKNFKGIKNIPIGIHYIYSSAVNDECITGQRIGFMENFNHCGYFAKRWISASEDFCDISLTCEDIQRFNSNTEEISLYLGSYPMECYKDWVALSNFITPHTLQRVLPECGRIYSCPQFLSERSSTQERLAAVEKLNPKQNCSPEDRLPKMELIPETKFRFTPIADKPLYPTNSTPSEITTHCMDQTYTLNVVVQSIQLPNCHGDETSNVLGLDIARELVAEFQIAFLSFLLNHLLDSWEHWRRVFRLLANSELAIRLYPQLYIDFITVLYHQLTNANRSNKEGQSKSYLSESPAELIDLFFSQTTASDAKQSLLEPQFLPVMLSHLLSNIQSVCSVSECTNEITIQRDLLADLFKRADGFSHSMRRRFNWNLPLLSNDLKHVDEIPYEDVDWEGDEAPVVVEIH